ncbi:MAG: Crp/Fnr family transcriptional regulator [Bacilli bacterium]|nr:Crp/Fnr family transcriptional regulator [Bacilli bacterium]
MIIDLLKKEDLELTKIVKVNKGEIIFHENDECFSIGIVYKGTLTISSITFEGNEIIYNTLYPGDIFGNNLLFSKDKRYKGNVSAVTDSVIYLIDKNSLLKILKTNEDFLIKYLEIHSEFSKSLNSKIKLLSFNNAKERFLYYLFINDNEITIKNISSLAKSLFLSREVTSRLINQMLRNKEIKRIGNKLYLNEKKHT